MDIDFPFSLFTDRQKLEIKFQIPFFVRIPNEE